MMDLEDFQEFRGKSWKRIEAQLEGWADPQVEELALRLREGLGREDLGTDRRSVTDLLWAAVGAGNPRGENPRPDWFPSDREAPVHRIRRSQKAKRGPSLQELREFPREPWLKPIA